MYNVSYRDLLSAGWEKGAGGAWYLKMPNDSQTHLHLGGSGSDPIRVKFVSIKHKDSYHAHYYNEGHFINRGNLEDLPEDVQTLFRVGLNRIGMG